MSNSRNTTDQMSASIERDLQEAGELQIALQILYCITGKGKVSVGKEVSVLSLHDFVAIQPGDAYLIAQEPGSLLMRVLIPCSVMMQYAPAGGTLLSRPCNSTVDADAPGMQPLQSKLEELSLLLVSPRRKSNCRQQGILLEILDLLIEYFMDSRVIGKTGGSDDKVQYIKDYVNRHYEESISLKKLSEDLYTSQATLSRLFRAQTGMYFGDYLNAVRLENAASRLVHYDTRIAQISTESGFSTPSSFSAAFLKRFGMTPSAYREKARAESAAQLPLQKAEDDVVIETPARDRTFSVGANLADVSKDNRITPNWNAFLNIGAAHNLLLSNFQFHVEYLTEHLHFRYVRIWNIFAEDMNIRKSVGDTRYSFEQVDIALDFIVSRHLKVFLDLGRRPQTAVTGENQALYFQEIGLCYRDLKDWENLLTAFLRHIIGRYGREICSSWIYMAMMDPSQLALAFQSGNVTVKDIHNTLVRTVRRELPGALVSGIEIEATADPARLCQILQCAQEDDTVPDFIDVVSFPVIYADGEHTSTRKITSRDVDINAIRGLRNAMDNAGCPDVRLFVSDWNCVLSNRNYLNDSTYRAAALVRLESMLMSCIDMLGIWMATDWISSFYDTAGAAEGSSGIITRDSVRKPVFWAVDFLNRLDPDLLQIKDSVIVTADNHTDCHVLTCNCKNLSSAFYSQRESRIDPGNMASLFEDVEPAALELSLQGFQANRKYMVKKRVITQDDRSLLGAWKELGFETSLSGSDRRYLRDTCTPRLTILPVMSDDTGTIHLSDILSANETVLYHIFCEN